MDPIKIVVVIVMMMMEKMIITMLNDHMHSIPSTAFVDYEFTQATTPRHWYHYFHLHFRQNHSFHISCCYYH